MGEITIGKFPKNIESSKNAHDLFSKIAMDIGKEVVHHIEMQYPAAIKATSSTFKISVRNCVHNEIMAAIKFNDEGEIIARMEKRKKFRSKLKSMRNDYHRRKATRPLQEESK